MTRAQQIAAALAKIEHLAVAVAVGAIAAVLSIPITGEINWRSVLHSGADATAGALGLGAYLRRSP